jgi:hypothetical protein
MASLAQDRKMRRKDLGLGETSELGVITSLSTLASPLEEYGGGWQHN